MAPIFYRYSSIRNRQESQYELWRQGCDAFGKTEGPLSTLLEHTPLTWVLLGGEEAVFVSQRLHPCQKRSCETPYKGTSSHSTLVGFGCIWKWPWGQFLSRAWAVGCQTDASLVLFHDQSSKTLSAVVLRMGIWGEWLKGDAILFAPLYRFDLIHLVVRAYHFYVQIVAFSKPIDEVLSQGQIFTFLGRLREVDDGHSCGFVYYHHYSSHHSSVALVVIPAVFYIEPVNPHSVEGSCWLVGWGPTWYLLRYLGHGAVRTLKHFFASQ